MIDKPSAEPDDGREPDVPTNGEHLDFDDAPITSDEEVGSEPEYAEAAPHEGPTTESGGPPARNRSLSDDMGDAAAVVGTVDPVASDIGNDTSEPNWDRELSPQRIAVELKKLETEVRKLLDDRDPKRKRRLAGTRRWHDLEDDIIALRYTNRIDESALAALQTLVSRRHYLFGRLHFLALTRPGWNS